MPSSRNKMTPAQVLEYLDTISESQLLENSAIIYAMDNTTRSTDLMNKIRYDALTLEELYGELEKVDTLLESLSSSTKYAPVTEATKTKKYKALTREEVSLHANNFIKSDNEQLQELGRAMKAVIGPVTHAGNAVKRVLKAIALILLGSSIAVIFTGVLIIGLLFGLIMFLAVIMPITLVAILLAVHSKDIRSKLMDRERKKTLKAAKKLAKFTGTDPAEEYCDFVDRFVGDLQDGHGVSESYNMPIYDYNTKNNTAKFKVAIENEIRRRTDLKSILTENMIYFYEYQYAMECDGCDCDRCNEPILQTLVPDNISATLQREDSTGRIGPMGICRMVQTCCDPDSCISDPDHKTAIKNAAKERILNTCKYELSKPEVYRDCPTASASKYAEEFLKDFYKGFDDIENEIDDFFTDVHRDVFECVNDYVREEAINASASFNPDPFDVYTLTPFPVAQRTVADTVTDIITADDDNELCEALLSYVRLENAYNHIYGDSSVTEASLKGPMKAVRSVVRGSDKVANGIVRKGAKKTVSAGKEVGKIFTPWEKLVQDTINKVREAKTDEARRNIIDNGTTVKLMKIFKNGLKLLIAGSLIHANILLGALSLIAMFGIDKHYEKKERNKILRELEEELRIVNEKIDDSRGDEDKQKKYELMRIRDQLQHDIDRIKLHLKY